MALRSGVSAMSLIGRADILSKTDPVETLTHGYIPNLNSLMRMHNCISPEFATLFLTRSTAPDEMRPMAFAFTAASMYVSKATTLLLAEGRRGASRTLWMNAATIGRGARIICSAALRSPLPLSPMKTLGVSRPALTASQVVYLVLSRPMRQSEGRTWSTSWPYCAFLTFTPQLDRPFSLPTRAASTARRSSAVTLKSPMLASSRGRAVSRIRLGGSMLSEGPRESSSSNCRAPG
mmetsp:Transcript_15215/g.43511  ORF Transcript_15215/g.43511 Transcript_15215/m.43511 type:complete len:235 (+) Transcript_15215:241-945(+)